MGPVRTGVGQILEGGRRKMWHKRTGSFSNTTQMVNRAQPFSLSRHGGTEWLRE